MAAITERATKIVIMEYSDFVPFDIAEALKTVGFDVPCAFYFAKADSDEDMMLIVSDGETLDHNNVANDNPFLVPVCSAPSYHTTLEWLRREHSIHCFAVVDADVEDSDDIWQGANQMINGGLCISVEGHYDTCSGALDAAIISAIKQVS